MGYLFADAFGAALRFFRRLVGAPERMGAKPPRELRTTDGVLYGTANASFGHRPDYDEHALAEIKSGTNLVAVGPPEYMGMVLNPDQKPTSG